MGVFAIPGKENMEQQQARYVVVPARVLNDRNLTPTEKIVYARICSFERFFESVKATADFLGCSVPAIYKAKQHLEKLGYIKVVANTGRGKTYVACYPETVRNAPEPAEETKNAETVNHAGNDEKPHTEPLSGQLEQEYGNADVNEVLKAFEKAKNRPITSRKTAQRRAAYNMLRNKNIGRERLMWAITVAIPAMAVDEYGIAINGLDDLQSKWDKVVDWIQRQKVKKQAQEATTGDEFKRWHDEQKSVRVIPVDELPDEYRY